MKSSLPRTPNCNSEVVLPISIIALSSLLVDSKLKLTLFPSKCKVSNEKFSILLLFISIDFLAIIVSGVRIKIGSVCIPSNILLF